MNCPKCNASIDYHFSTTCEHCQAELPCLAPATEPIESTPPVHTAKPRLSIVDCVRKAFLVLVTSGTCSLVGALVTYAVAGVFYRMFLYDPAGPHSCGDGMDLALLSLLGGAFLGCTGGSIIGYKFRLSTDGMAE